MLDHSLTEVLAQWEAQGLRRRLKTVEGPQAKKIIIDGREVLNFCSNNYLGLADDQRLRQAASDCIQKEGLGAGASRLVCGNMSAHRRLEEKLAQFKGTEDCLVFSTGYMANVGIISSLFDREDIIFSDRLNHASIIDGILLSGAGFKRYLHKDTAALEEMLKKSNGFKKRAIITDSVFSMDGDVAPLKEIVRLAKKYDCLVMVDEAHAVGVFGKKGTGVVEHLGLTDHIDIQMGTLSKAVGAFGAYCCGSKTLISFLINRARAFIYTTGLPPAIAAAAAKAIAIIEEETWRRQRLWENTNHLKEGLKRLGFDTMESESPIIPILVKTPDAAVQFSRQLFGEGIFVQAIRPPTVPVHTPRLRVTVMATHCREDLDFAIEKFKKIGRELKII